MSEAKSSKLAPAASKSGAIGGIPQSSTHNKVGGRTQIKDNPQGSTGFNGSNPLVTFQGRTATPISLIQHRHITYVNPSKNKANDAEIDAIEEETTTTLHSKRSFAAVPSLAKKSAFGSTAGYGSTGTMPHIAHTRKEVDDTEIVQLSETTTEIVFSLMSFIAASDTRSIVAVEEKNAKYVSLVEAHKNPDGFSDRSTQTLNAVLKNKDEMTSTNAVREMSCQATSFEILDSIASSFNTGDDEALVGHHDESDPAGLSPHMRSLLSETLKVAKATPGCFLDTTIITKPNYTIANKRSDAMTSSNTNDLTAASRRGNLIASQSNLGAASKSNLGKHSSSKRTVTGINGGMSESNFGGYNPEVELIVELKDKAEILLDFEANRIMQSKQLLRSLHVAERAIQQNAYHHKHLDYRDLPDGVTSPLLSSSLVDHADNSTSKTGLSLGLSKSIMSDDKVAKSARSSTGKGNPKSSRASNHGVETVGKQSNYGDAQSHQESVYSDDREADGEVEGKVDKVSGQIHLLYSYRNDELVRGRPVTSMCWNCVNLDLLTVGYGTLETVVDSSKLGAAVDEELLGGLVLFWSLRNPDYPEKILRTPHAVTCLDFSKQTPSLLAVGLISGDVLVYDMRRQRESDWGTPVESSVHIQGGHTDPVWQVSWVLKGADRLETLVSISTDGSILEWNLKKGLVVTSLMQLKKNGVGEGWISRKAAGLCFDFLPNDPASYMAGTEDGNVHHCSIAYNEQYLNTFEKSNGGNCHDGPVYRIAFSPHWPDVFLTSSADWTMSLFHAKHKVSLFNMHATGEDHSVKDVCWCPGNSTLFAAVTSSRLQIWDLSVSCIDPVINLDASISDEPQQTTENKVNDDKGDESRPGTGNAHTGLFTEEKTDLKDRKESAVQRLLKNLSHPCATKTLTCVKFGERSPTVAVGDNMGVVSVYRVSNPVSITHEGPLQQTDRLRRAVLKHTDPEKALRMMDSFKSAQPLVGAASSVSIVDDGEYKGQ